MKLIKLAVSILFCISFFSFEIEAQELWGTAFNGGNDNCGVIFKTDKTGNNLEVVKKFERLPYINASKPMFTKLLMYDSKFYGTTTQGGEHNNGVLFEYDPVNNSFNNLHEFQRGEFSHSPHGSIVEYGGELYGTARYGENGGGALFKYSFEHGYQQLVNLLAPIGGPVVLNEKLYGLVHVGGEGGNDGFLYQYDPNSDNLDPLKIKINFNENEGANPRGELLVLNNKLYGSTVGGGVYDKGIIFEYEPDGDFVKLHDFDEINGAHPGGSLIELAGNLYGMTTFGGSNDHDARAINNQMPVETGDGTIFKYDLYSEIFTKLYDFDALNGAHPYGSLIEYEGKLFGVTSHGGVTDDGVLFEYNLSNDELTKKEDFQTYAKGNDLLCSLAEWKGKLYGMAHYGGVAHMHGTLFEFDPNTGILVKKLDFNNEDRHAQPSAGLLEFNGKFYGMAPYGGEWSVGMIYEIDPLTNGFTISHSFDGINGQWPWGELMEYDGKLYGLTSRGGLTDCGTLFEFDPATGILDKKIDFNRVDYGNSPSNGHLVEINGKLYGLATWGGLNQKGTLFEYDPDSGILTKKFDFGGENGENPWGGLTVLDDKLYGMTANGGSIDPGHGVIFEYDPSIDSFTKKFDWHGLDGSQPRGNLLEWQGKLYGMTLRGGIDPTPVGAGVMFEFNPAAGIQPEDAYHVLANFNELGNPFGANPLGSLMELCGNFYGVTAFGGENNLGTLFEFDPIAESFERIINFDGNNGAMPRSVTLLARSFEMTSISASVDPSQLGEEIFLTVNFSDNRDEFVDVIVDWGDNTIENVTLPSLSFNLAHTYSSTGVYTVSVTLNQAFCGEDFKDYKYIVIYDPSDGFVTGGGWIDSPEGAYLAEPSLTGTANFGFVAKYKKGKTVPEGNTEFQFQAGNLNFHSEDFEWLIIAGPKAMFKGVGTINGSGFYGFQVSAIDANLTPSTDVDLFRIRIWDKNNNDALVYDNKVGEDDPNADPTTEITGGSITIHKSDIKKSGYIDDIVAVEIPDNYNLRNYPNPFNNATIIEFTLPTESKVFLKVYNIFGQEIETLINQNYIPGTYSVEFNGNELPAGQYLYRLNTFEYSITKKMNLCK